MNRTSFHIRIISSIVGWAFSLMASLGDEITIVNPSFESITGTDLNYFDSAGHLLPNRYTIKPSQPHDATAFLTSDPIPGWTTVGTAGTANYASRGVLTPVATDGFNVAYANGYFSQHGSFSQTLGSTYQPGLTYTLRVDVGGFTQFGQTDYSVSLYAGNTIVGTSLNPVSLIPGTFTTANFSVAVDQNSSALGQPITIVLANAGTPTSGNEVVFDNVHLTTQTTTVPEPSTWILTAVGLVGLVTFGRKANRK